MVIFELSPEDVLTFDVEDISDAMQSSIALSCSSTTENSLVIFAVFSNPPLRYSIFPNTGFLVMNEPCVISVKLSNSELGLVRFLSTVPRDYFLSDHIAVVAMYLLAVMLVILAIYQQWNSQMPLGNTFSPTLVLLVESYLWSITSLQSLCRC